MRHPRTTLVAVGVLLVGGGCGPASPELGPADGRDLPGVALGRIQVGEKAPDFTLASYRGAPVTLSDFQGEKDVILVFYRGHW